MGKKWQGDRKRDRFYKQAKKDNYRSRASYKLKQINRRFKLIRKNNVVLDLGAAPGGWLQVASEIVGEGGFVLGIDLEEIDGFEEENVVALKEDMTGEGVVDKIMEILPRGPDVVISDASPDISGVWDIDHLLSVELSRAALGLAKKLLQPGGNFLVKVFQGSELKEFTEDVKREFRIMKIVKPEASRGKSSEVYILGRELLDTPVRFGDTISVRIEERGKEGDGIAFVDGFPVFVENAKVGEELDIRIKKVTPRFAKAKII
ncbi:MAG: 23S rRNA (uridine(2552)-2'-O)-methyltransferase [Candidatus Hydrothermarchaeales archaeon]